MDGATDIIEPEQMRIGIAELPSKYYVDGGHSEIVVQQIQDLGLDGKLLRTVQFIDFTAGRVRTFSPRQMIYASGGSTRRSARKLSTNWRNGGVDMADMATQLRQPDADPFDLLCHLAYQAPLRTRRERAERLRREQQDFFDRHSQDARTILEDLLEKYATDGTAQFTFGAALQLPPLSQRGNVLEIARAFGGPAHLQQAVTELQTLLYAA